MKKVSNNLLISIVLLSTLLLNSGCVPKNADGSYSSAYPYHPYLNGDKNQKIVNYMSNNIEKTAKSLLGRDYKYGANGPYQFDCSSFTQYVFAQHGIKLPRVSKEQAKIGKYISSSQLQKGDLIFFDSKKSKRISHVGIYLGGGEFIHASSSQDRVTISKLNSNYYSKHFKWGRRVINNYYAMQ